MQKAGEAIHTVTRISTEVNKPAPRAIDWTEIEKRARINQHQRGALFSNHLDATRILDKENKLRILTEELAKSGLITRRNEVAQALANEL